MKVSKSDFYRPHIKIGSRARTRGYGSEHIPPGLNTTLSYMVQVWDVSLMIPHILFAYRNLPNMVCVHLRATIFDLQCSTISGHVQVLYSFFTDLLDCLFSLSSIRGVHGK